jgi:hypothetical protein
MFQKRVWLTLFLLRFLDLWVFYFYNSINQWNFFSFFISFIFELFLLSFLFYFQCFLRYSLQVLVAGILSLTFALFEVSQGVIFRNFAEYSTGHMLIYLRNDPLYIMNGTLTFFKNQPISMVPVLIFFAIFLKVWWPKKAIQSAKLIPTFCFSFLSIVLAVIVENQLKHETTGLYKTALAASAVAVSHAAASTNNNKLHVTIRELIDPILLRRRPNVFFFIGESWGKKENPFFDTSSPASMPFLFDYVKSNPHRIFQSAYTNSSATDVSLPSLLSGVGPEEGSDKLHRLPLLWDWFKAMGYTTLFVTPQKLAFAGMEQFLAGRNLDYLMSSEKLSSPIVNDNGVDDLIAAESADLALQGASPEKPVLLVFFSNATHYPFLQRSSKLPEIPANFSRYQKALYITDKSIELLFKKLQKHHRSENLLSVFTADHGEVENSKRKVPRISSFYEEITNIPLIFVESRESTYKNKRCWRGFERNQTENIQNLDLVPTLIDFLSDGAGEKNLALQQELSGSSLCKDVPDRVLIQLNTNQIRQWKPEGFGLVYKNYRYVFSNIEGPHLFDLHADINETESKFIDQFPLMDRKKFDAIIQKNRELKRIWKSL